MPKSEIRLRTNDEAIEKNEKIDNPNTASGYRPINPEFEIGNVEFRGEILVYFIVNMAYFIFEDSYLGFW